MIIRIVENLDSEHNEAGIVAASYANVVKVIEACAELGANEGVSRRVKLSSDAVGLEAEDTGGNEIDIVAPSRDNRVAFDTSAGNTRGSKTVLESFPGISEGNFLSFSNTVANKAVLSAAAT